MAEQDMFKFWKISCLLNKTTKTSLLFAQHNVQYSWHCLRSYKRKLNTLKCSSFITSCGLCYVKLFISLWSTLSESHLLLAGPWKFVKTCCMFET